MIDRGPHAVLAQWTNELLHSWRYVCAYVCMAEQKLHTKAGFSQPYFKQLPYFDYKICQCVWRNENLLSRLYPAKSLAEKNPATVCPEKQHLGGALRRRASCHLLCTEKYLQPTSDDTTVVFALYLKALHFHFEIKYLNTSSSCAYLARSELLQTQGRTPGQWRISS